MSRRIAIVAHHVLGGSGVMAVQWAGVLADRGHDVHLFRAGSSPRDALVCTGRDAGPTLHTVRPAAHPVLDAPSREMAMGAAVLVEHARAPFDVVHVHYAVPFALLVPLLRAAPDAPACVVSLHGSDVTGVGADPSYAAALRLAVACADALTAPGPWLAAEAAALLAGTAGRAEVELLPNFVDLEHFAARNGGGRAEVEAAFGADDGSPVVLHVSNLRPVKRAQDAIEAVRLLRQTVPARLIVAGDGPERAALEALAADALGDAVAFVGAVEDPAPLLRDADALILPSESESFGLAALEALATGTPVVASDAGGLSDWLVGREAARLCPVGDVVAFASALETLLSPSVDRAALRRSAREIAEAHGSPTAAALAAESLYERIRSRR